MAAQSTNCNDRRRYYLSARACPNQ
jgi:hypothetical protein